MRIQQPQGDPGRTFSKDPSQECQVYGTGMSFDRPLSARRTGLQAKNRTTEILGTKTTNGQRAVTRSRMRRFTLSYSFVTLLPLIQPPLPMHALAMRRPENDWQHLELTPTPLHRVRSRQSVCSDLTWHCTSILRGRWSNLVYICPVLADVLL